MRFSILISYTVSVKKKIHNYILEDYDSRRRKCEIIAKYKRFLLEESKYKFKTKLLCRDLQNLVYKYVVGGVWIEKKIGASTQKYSGGRQL